MSDLELLDAKGLEQKIIELLGDNYILIYGVQSLIQIIERTVYKPGTKENRNFIAGILPCFPPKPLYLGKKTSKLKEFIGEKEVKDFEWENLIAITLLPTGSDQIFCNITCIKNPKQKENQIRKIAKFYKSFITGLEAI